MSRLKAIDPTKVQGQAKTLLDELNSKFGMYPNSMRTLANSPAALNAFLSMEGALAEGSLDPKLRTEIALAVAQVNGCSYCLSVHTTIGKMRGVSEGDLVGCRRHSSENPKFDAALKFVNALVTQRGNVTDAQVKAVKQAGYSDGDIVEFVGHVAMSVFANYFNLVAQTEIDFPKVSPESLANA
jgi:uncharacterized peroxidase-related enzyme